MQQTSGQAPAPHQASSSSGQEPTPRQASSSTAPIPSATHTAHKDESTPRNQSQAAPSSSLRIVIPPSSRRQPPSCPSSDRESLPPTPDAGDAEHHEQMETARALAALQEEYAIKAAALRAGHLVPQPTHALPQPTHAPPNNPSSNTDNGAGRSTLPIQHSSPGRSTQATLHSSSRCLTSPLEESHSDEDASPDNDPFSHPYFDLETKEDFWEADSDGDHFYRFQANSCMITYRGEAPECTGRPWSEVEHFTIFRRPLETEYSLIPGSYRIPRYSIHQRRDARIEWVQRHGFPEDIVEEDGGGSDSDYEQSQLELQEHGRATDADLEADTDTDIDLTPAKPVSSTVANVDKGKGRAVPAIPLPSTTNPSTMHGADPAVAPVPPVAPSGSSTAQVSKVKGRVASALPLPSSTNPSTTQVADPTVAPIPFAAPPGLPTAQVDNGADRTVTANRLLSSTHTSASVTGSTVKNVTAGTSQEPPSAKNPSLSFIHPRTTFKTGRPSQSEISKCCAFGTELLSMINGFANEVQRSPELIMQLAGLLLSLDGSTDTPWNNFQSLYSLKTPNVPHDGMFNFVLT